MTTRYRAVLITLEEPMRDDDFEESVGPALRTMRFVHTVQPLEDDKPFHDDSVRFTRDEDWDRELREFVHRMRFG